jgi:hypothetical protein
MHACDFAFILLTVENGRLKMRSRHAQSHMRFVIHNMSGLMPANADLKPGPVNRRLLAASFTWASLADEALDAGDTLRARELIDLAFMAHDMTHAMGAPTAAVANLALDEEKPQRDA